MRRTVLLLAAMAFAVPLCWSCGLSLASTAPSKPSARPNIVFILVDDMRKDDLAYMPKTRALLGDQGMRFEKAFVSFPLCCPSRATIMRGQYAHNTGVWDNTRPNGGWQSYVDHGNERDNVATRLDDAGYTTGLFGKYLNQYSTTDVPTGWDDWFASHGPVAYFDYDVNDNGTLRHFGTTESDYSTDVLSARTQEFIDASVGAGEPFFAYVAPKAPHSTLPIQAAVPAPRHEGVFDGEQAPRLDSFDEEYVSDKPPWIRSLPPLTATQAAEIDSQHEGRVESLQSVDDLVTAVVTKLDNIGVLDDTYVVFTSDNGWHHGEHRIPNEKHQPYEESIRVPLLVRGPGVQARSSTGKLTLNTDFLPTFTDLAGVTTPEYVDGRSLRPLLEGHATPSWRSAILLEHRHVKASTIERPRASFYGIRTSGGRKYVEYEGGFKERYDLKTDPFERTNSYDATAPPQGLTSRLHALKSCAGDGCRTAENGP